MAKRKQKEKKIQTDLSDWIKDTYPELEFFNDIASGMKLTIGQAVLAQRWRSSPSFPDTYILEPRKGYAALFLELKICHEDVYLMNGEISSKKHIQAQNKKHIKLREKGFLTVFSPGLRYSKELIRWYMDDSRDGEPMPVSKPSDSEPNIFS